MKTALTFICIWLSSASFVEAEEAPVIELTISPQAIETPILKYRLLPAESELQEGNAATILLRVPWDQTAYMERIYPTLKEWAERPLDAAEWADFTKEFVVPNSFYTEMKRAAFRRDAMWEYPLNEQPLAFIRLPDVQQLRSFLGYGLAAKAKYHLSRGELKQAREAIMVGLANGRHVARTPFFVTQLVASVSHQAMLDQISLLISRPDSPNLYWALSMLPDSLLNLDRTADLEADFLVSSLPGTQDLERPRDAAEWTRMADQLIEYLRYSDELEVHEPEQINEERVRLAGVAREALPTLLNLTADRVATMTDEEALIRYLVHVKTILDHTFAVALKLPPPEAAPHLRKLDAVIAHYEAETGFRIDIHRRRTAYVQLRSVSRKIQALRIVEAIRDYAASHDGKLPEELSAVREVPIPIDPLSGQPFLWTFDKTSDSATLATPPISSDFGDPSAGAMTYRLRVR